jgi:hypothetical protein
MLQVILELEGCCENIYQSYVNYTGSSAGKIQQQARTTRFCQRFRDATARYLNSPSTVFRFYFGDKRWIKTISRYKQKEKNQAVVRNQNFFF